MEWRRFVRVNTYACAIVHSSRKVDGGVLRLVVKNRGEELSLELVPVFAGVLLCSGEVIAGRDDRATNIAMI